ncbi:MAG: Uma2 family endonuclease [Verrucomicrobiota bacterium]
MLKSAPGPITAADLRELPQGPPYYQLIEGDLFMSPTPSYFHQRIVLKIALILSAYLEKNPIGEITIAPSDVELSEHNVFEPDLYYVANERKHIITKQGVSGAPNLVVEVLSPGTAKFDKGVKRQVYARHDVKELWLVDPDAKEIAVYHLQESADKPVGVYGPRQRFSSPLFPRLTVQVAKVFQT